MLMRRSIVACVVLCMMFMISGCSGGTGGTSSGGGSLPQIAPQPAATAVPSKMTKTTASALTRQYTAPAALPSTFTIYCPNKARTGTFISPYCAYYDPGTTTNQYIVGGGANCGVSDLESLQTKIARVGIFKVTGYSPGSCTISLTDSNNTTAAGSIVFSGGTILGPLALTCPANASGSANCTYANPSYTRGYTVETSSTNCSAATPTLGAFTVTDSVLETCTVTLNATVTGQQVHAAIAFVALSQKFSYTGAAQTFTVPSGVTQITVDAVGASGGLASSLYTGGLGYEVTATLVVNAGDVLDVYVGGAGAAASGFGGCTGGFNGGGNPTCQGGGGGAGGGGASDIRPSGGALTDRVIVAGGGGGAEAGAANGGNAGYLFGASGSHSPGVTVTVGDATGGTQNMPGAAGTNSSGFNGSTGSFGNGGAGFTNGEQTEGGGGGGGWYGGGGGSNLGSGGGGSSHLAASATLISNNQATSAQCDANNDGCIAISW